MLTHHSQDIYSIKYSPTGNYLASVSGDSKITLWDVNPSTGKHKLAKEISVIIKNSDINVMSNVSDGENKDCIISCVCWSGDGKYLFVASLGSSLYIINVEIGVVSYHPSGHLASIYHLNLSFDGAKLASASLDKTIRIWQVAPNNNQQLTLLSCLAILEGHQVLFSLELFFRIMYFRYVFLGTLSILYHRQKTLLLLCGVLLLIHFYVK